MDVGSWRTRYTEKRPVYERFTKELLIILQKLMDIEGIKPALVEGRTKEVESFEGKLTRPSKSYADPLAEVTDLTGLRIVLYSLDDAKKVRNLLYQEFTVDTNRSVDKLEQLEADRFGYLSQHYIIKLKESRSNLSEWRGLGDLWAEVQVRTVLQHAWAVIQHPLDYKSQYNIPLELRRRLFRVSALFELADEELNKITRESQVLLERHKYNIKSKQEMQEMQQELDLDSLKAYIYQSSVFNDWMQMLIEMGTKVILFEDPIRAVEIARFVGINTIDELDDIMAQSKQWAKDFMLEYLKYPNHISMHAPHIITLALIANFPDKLNLEVLQERFGYQTKAEKMLQAATKHNPRFQNTLSKETTP